MRFTIITHVHHKNAEGKFFGYGPYVREMNIWGKYVDEIEIVAPFENAMPDIIDLPYDNPKIVLTRIAAFSAIGMRAKCNAMLQVPRIALAIFRAMRRSDHIHLRCPGNIGLIGCFVQILFPSKPKTAKYAGNWDPNSKQPLSYKVQKWLLSNTWLTKNMTVLVYGKWKRSNRNILPFFTATYRASDVVATEPRPLTYPIKFVFVGSLSAGKQPLYAVQIVEKLNGLGIRSSLDLYGEGKQRDALETYIAANGLAQQISLKGNQNEATVRAAYKQSHFLLLPSRSEGWPKVVAEAMFWGTVPISTAVSCVPQMLDNGNRGLVLQMKLENDAAAIARIVRDPTQYERLASAAMEWSRAFTLDKFESEIAKLINAK